MRMEIQASHVLPRRQRAGQARGGQASGSGRAHAVAVHGQAGQQRRRGTVHGPLGPEVSAIHPPRECRGQPPTRPAGLAQWDLKVRPRRSPRVLGRRGLRGVHGGGQRGLRSAAGPRPGAHRRPAVGPLRAARRSCARRRTRRLARLGSRLRAPATTTPVAAPAPGAARRPCCLPSRGRRSPPPPAAASHFLPAFPFFGRKPLPGPSARRANSSALPRPGSRSPRKSQLSSRRAPRFLIKSR